MEQVVLGEAISAAAQFLWQVPMTEGQGRVNITITVHGDNNTVICHARDVNPARPDDDDVEQVEQSRQEIMRVYRTVERSAAVEARVDGPSVDDGK